MTDRRIKWTRGLTAVAAGTLWSAAPAESQKAGSETALMGLVDAFTQAQRNYDQTILASLTTAGYVEVSPVGDVDTREEMLSFYAPEKKRPSPALMISERVVRRDGNDAVIVVKLGFVAPGPNGVTRTVAMRASFVARQAGRGWKIAAAHYTPLRSQGS